MTRRCIESHEQGPTDFCLIESVTALVRCFYLCQITPNVFLGTVLFMNPRISLLNANSDIWSIRKNILWNQDDSRQVVMESLSVLQNLIINPDETLHYDGFVNRFSPMLPGNHLILRICSNFDVRNCHFLKHLKVHSIRKGNFLEKIFSKRKYGLYANWKREKCLSIPFSTRPSLMQAAFK